MATAAISSTVSSRPISTGQHQAQPISSQPVTRSNVQVTQPTAKPQAKPPAEPPAKRCLFASKGTSFGCSGAGRVRSTCISMLIEQFLVHSTVFRDFQKLHYTHSTQRDPQDSSNSTFYQKNNSTTRKAFNSSIHPAVHICVCFKTFQRHSSHFYMHPEPPGLHPIPAFFNQNAYSTHQVVSRKLH